MALPLPYLFPNLRNLRFAPSSGPAGDSAADAVATEALVFES